MNLHAISPRLHSKVFSLCESFFYPRIRIQVNPPPDARVNSIRSDDPPSVHELFTKDDPVTGQARDRCVPKQSNSARFCPFHHLLVKDGSTHSTTACTSKV